MFKLVAMQQIMHNYCQSYNIKNIFTRTATTATLTKNVKQAQDVIVMNPKFDTHFLPSLHGQFFWLLPSNTFPLIPSKSTISQIKSKMPYVGFESIVEKIERDHR